jgi:hypothetical protein
MPSDEGAYSVNWVTDCSTEAATEKRADGGGKYESLSDCHDVVFIGMVNVNKDNYLQGVVDVWRCRKCRRLYCDDRRYGEALKASVGFAPIPDDEKWGILICTTVKEVAMNSLGVKPGKKFTHTCKSGETHEFAIGGDHSLSPTVAGPIHRIYLVEEYVNKNIEAGYYTLTLR